MNTIKINKLLLIFSFSFLLFNCSNESEGIPQDIEVENFVWRGLNAWYYWRDDVPDLADTRFKYQSELNNFLRNFSSPESVFQALRYQPGVIDRFSVMVDDYIVLENSFQGITLNNGMEFKLYRNKADQTIIHGIVYYVIPGSDAETKGVIRGMIFNAVNGTQLTETNFRGLLFGQNPNYTISLSDYNNGNPTSNGNTIDLTKSQLQENPVAMAKVFDEGTTKIGYLLYNQFSIPFDDELNAAFAKFKAENVTDLIVDLRYNGGGSVRTATYLASMINGTNTGKLFAREVWNQKVLDANQDEAFYVNNFTDEIDNGSVKEAINSLSLNKVTFIVTGDTASASELVINGLRAYIDVSLVGEKTVGKQVGSITLYDSENLFKSGENLNTNHRYAMQPIVLEVKNALGENEPNGYEPNIPLIEDFGRSSNSVNLGVLGEKSDPLLAAAINSITNTTSSKQLLPSLKFEKAFVNSKFTRPFSQEMFVNKILR